MGLEGASFPLEEPCFLSVSSLYSLVVFGHSKYNVPFVFRIIVQNVCSIDYVINRYPSEAQRMACTFDAFQTFVEEAKCVQVQ